MSRLVAGNETEQTSRDTPERNDRVLTPFLIIGLECDRPLIPSSRHSLHRVHQVTIGRGTERLVQRIDEGGRTILSIQLPDRRLSVDHARIVREANGWVLEDRDSTNGSFVFGSRVQRHSISDGDVIELGRTLFVYSEMLASSGAAADYAPGLGDIPGLVTLDLERATELDRLRRVAASPVPILILGETGTGKEILARGVHVLSKRPGPFVAVNCGAIPEPLVESQLFGHVRGAFSGAVRDETGFVRSAHNGTLLLDEIGELPQSSQVALLRVLQSGEVVPVGTAKPQQADIRILAATHRPLEQLMKAGEFRPDLYARLAGFTHTIVPLRERLEDLGLLVAALLSNSSADRERLRFRVEAARAIYKHRWPLNVRELEQALTTASVLAQDGLIGPDDLPASVTSTDVESSDEPRNVVRSLNLSPADARLKQELEALLAASAGNLAEVARRMGKARQQVQRWVKRFGLDPGSYRE